MPVTRPGGSSRRDVFGSFDSVTMKAVMTIPRMPIGTLTKKMLCQDTCSTRKPPTTGPMAMARPDMAAQIPMAAPRSLPVNVAVMIDSEPGRSIAAPSPCTARKATSCSVLPDRPHISEPTVNSPSPPMKNRFRPYRSPSAPPVSMKDAKVNV